MRGGCSERSRLRCRGGRYVGRRVRQRHAVVEGDPAGRGVRPPPHLHRPRSRSGGKLGRTPPFVRSAAFVMGGLRPKADLEGRRRFSAHPEGDSAVARSKGAARRRRGKPRSEEHTSELQSLMRISYAVFCLKKKHIYLINN